MFLWMCNMQFRERSQKNFAKVRRFFDQSLKRTKKLPLLKALFSSKNRFWVYRLQNWQACQDYYANSPKITAPNPKELEKGDFNWKRLFYKTNLWDDRMQFWQTCISFRKSLKVTKWFIELQKKVPKNVLWTANMPLRERSQKLWPLSELFSLEVWKTKKKFFKDIVLKMLLRAQPTEIWPHC